MNKEITKSSAASLCTVPNLLSLIRLVLIGFVVGDLMHGESRRAAVLLLLSGLTDILDGFVARRFHMESAVGRILDPVADKLTQIAVTWALCTGFPRLLVLAFLLLAKELIVGGAGLFVIRHTGNIFSSEWHGKLCTSFVYLTLFLHILWGDMPDFLSFWLMITCIFLMIFSGVCYLRKYLSLTWERPSAQ